LGGPIQAGFGTAQHDLAGSGGWSALCFGWSDGVRNSVDAVSYKIRFTPRNPLSVQSAVNVKRATELSAKGLMHPAGLAAFQKHEGKRSEIYSYEQRKSAKRPAA